jgi:hypothetical protein
MRPSDVDLLSDLDRIVWLLDDDSTQSEDKQIGTVGARFHFNSCS